MGELLLRVVPRDIRLMGELLLRVIPRDIRLVGDLRRLLVRLLLMNPRSVMDAPSVSRDHPD